MIEPQIVCPNCRTEIKLTESLAAPLVAETRKRFEQQLAQKEADFAKREAGLRQTQDELAKAREAINDEVAKRLKAERASIVEAEAKKARLALANDLEQKDRQVADLQKILTDNNTKLAEAQKAQADVMRKGRELDDARRELDLAVEKKVQVSLATVRDQAKLEAEESLKAKVTEKEVQIAGMQRQIEELRRKADQGSQQLQGEALELELEILVARAVSARPDRARAEGRVRWRCPASRSWPFGAAVRHHPLGIKTDQELERRLARKTA